MFSLNTEITENETDTLFTFAQKYIHHSQIFKAVNVGFDLRLTQEASLGAQKILNDKIPKPTTFTLSGVYTSDVGWQFR